MEPSPESKQNAAPSLPSLIELYRNVVQKRHGQIVSELYWSRHKVSVDPGHSKKLRREKALIRRLLKAGIKGWAEKKTFYTRRLPSACRLCLRGKGASLSITYKCTRNCFFCPNPKPRLDEVRLGGHPAARELDVPRYARWFGLKVLGISGGDPLTRLPRTLKLVRLVSRRFGKNVRIHLYTNGDLLTEGTLSRLKGSGISEIRFNVAANGYNTGPVRLALRHFRNVAVEIPVIPQDKEKIKKLILDLDLIRLPSLILHELGIYMDNSIALKERGFLAKSSDCKGPFRPVSESGLVCLELLLFSLKYSRSLSVYYCSSDTEKSICDVSAAHRLRHLAQAQNEQFA